MINNEVTATSITTTITDTFSTSTGTATVQKSFRTTIILQQYSVTNDSNITSNTIFLNKQVSKP